MDFYNWIWKYSPLCCCDRENKEADPDAKSCAVAVVRVGAAAVVQGPRQGTPPGGAAGAAPRARWAVPRPRGAPRGLDAAPAPVHAYEHSPGTARHRRLLLLGWRRRRGSRVATGMAVPGFGVRYPATRASAGNLPSGQNTIRRYAWELHYDDSAKRRVLKTRSAHLTFLSDTTT